MSTEAEFDPYVERAKRYPISVAATESDPPYRAEVTDFPHVLAGGDSPEEAVTCAISAIADALEYLDDEGLPAPEPIAAYSGQFSVRLPRSLHRALATRAAAEGISLNAAITYTLAQALGSAGEPPRRRRSRTKTSA